MNKFSNKIILAGSYGWPNTLARASGDVNIFEVFVFKIELISV
jgi:hypothetical protein